MANWNSICLDSIKKEKAEIEKRYGIRFGQTEIYCARCGRPCTPGSHTCGDVRVKRWREAKRKGQKTLKRAKEMPKSEIPLSQDDLVDLNAPGAL